MKAIHLAGGGLLVFLKQKGKSVPMGIGIIVVVGNEPCPPRRKQHGGLTKQRRTERITVSNSIGSFK